MECLSPDHLHADGSSGWTAGSSLQQPECQSHQVQDEIPTAKIVSWLLQVYACTHMKSTT